MSGSLSRGRHSVWLWSGFNARRLFFGRSVKTSSPSLAASCLPSLPLSPTRLTPKPTEDAKDRPPSTWKTMPLRLLLPVGTGWCRVGSK